MVGKQLLVIAFSLVLARLLGPENYGIVAQATVYTALATLLLDQGVSAALISQKTVTRTLFAASMTLNIGVAGLIALVTIPLAPWLADFFNTPQLEAVLLVLAGALLFKGIAVVPRVALLRQLRFRALAVCETGSVLLGGVAGVVMALLGFEYWAIVGQLVVADVVLTLVLLAIARPPAPTLNLAPLRETIGFSGRVFMGDLLSYGSRNADTVLVGRFLGEAQVGLYSLAYRMLMTPIQMVGQTVSRVLLPLISRRRANKAGVSALLLRSARNIAFLVFPAMTFVSVGAWDLVQIGLGEAWLPAAPVLSILAITGARQSVTALNTPVIVGFGRADIQLKFNLVAAIVQIGGMVAGLPFGIVGVALGYTIAGFLLTPLVFWIQRILAGTPISRQIRVLAAPAHASFWAGLAYVALGFVLPGPWLQLLVGGLVGGVVCALVLAIFHRRAVSDVLADGVALSGLRRTRKG